MEKERYNLNKGRERPPYKPKDIRCPGCGATLTIKDERSELVVCEYCGSHLDVTASEEKVLGKGPGRKQDFPLKLGDSFRYKGTRFEIIARMAFIEDNDYSEMTRQYLLYNPRRGVIWLDEYQGQYSISRNSHVMPTSEPFTKTRGDILKTHDGNKWVTEGIGIYDLIYVDGALPWIAKVGDEIQYAEFSEESGSGKQYEVQKIAGEIEYGMGKALSLEFVRRATKKPDLGKEMVRKAPADAATIRKLANHLLLIASLAMVVNGIFSLYCLYSSEVVLDQGFTESQLTGKTFSKPFKVAENNNVIKITTTASPSLNNEWMAMKFAIVRSDDMVLHVGNSDIAYYYDGDQSEGGQENSEYIKIPQAGTYRLLLHAVSAQGNATTSTTTQHGARIRIKDGVLTPRYFNGAAILSLIFCFIIFSLYGLWMSGDYDD